MAADETPLTKREAYAKSAMEALVVCHCGNPAHSTLVEAAHAAGRTVEQQIAVAAFLQADAMLAEAERS